MTYCLVQLNGASPGSSFPLEDAGDTVTIGRDPSCQLPVDDELASRRHAKLWRAGSTWQVEDCGSRNGTQVNSRPIDRAALVPGDLIRVGDRLLMFLEEHDGFDPARLRHSVLAASTSVIRLPASGDREPLLERVRRESSSRSVRNVSLLCRLAAELHQQADVQHLTRVVGKMLVEATGAKVARVWLSGRDGRLACDDESSDTEEQASEGRLLAGMVMERDEGLLTSLAEPMAEEADRDAARGTLIGVPIPGAERPRGAIECQAPDHSLGFDQRDLELAIAVAHQFGLALETIEQREQLQLANQQLRSRVEQQGKLIGDSPAMLELHDQTARVAAVGSNVLVLGESGTGKELVARTLHDLSPRSDGPFVAVNCAAFNETLLESELFGHEKGAFTGADRRRLGQFERAHRGTLFLDEVGEMSLACQAKLLRVLEGHPFERLGGTEAVRVDVRLVAATHRDLREWVRDGKFREDLFFRLRVIELRLPPLRERGDDVMRLALEFLDRFRRELGRGPARFSPEAAEAIRSYAWPGNVRELKNAIERAVVLSRQAEVTPEDLGLLHSQSEGSSAATLCTLQEAERKHIRLILDATEGNKTKACQILGIGRGTLYKKLASLKA